MCRAEKVAELVQQQLQTFGLADVVGPFAEQDVRGQRAACAAKVCPSSRELVLAGEADGEPGIARPNFAFKLPQRSSKSVYAIGRLPLAIGDKFELHAARAFDNLAGSRQAVAVTLLPAAFAKGSSSSTYRATRIVPRRLSSASCAAAGLRDRCFGTVANDACHAFGIRHVS